MNESMYNRVALALALAVPVFGMCGLLLGMCGMC